MNTKTIGLAVAVSVCAASSFAVFAAPVQGSKAAGKNSKPTTAASHNDKAQIIALRNKIASQQTRIARLSRMLKIMRQRLAAAERREAALKSRLADKNSIAGQPTLAKAAVPPVLNFTLKNLAGQAVNLKKYQGRVLLMVNTASQCGYTPQYKGLQELHKLYGKQGLSVLGFPSNDFGQQVPGSEADIATFCQKNYGVEFDMFSKIGVKGSNKSALYKYLTSEETNTQSAGEVQWNFEKFLIGRDGRIIHRFPSDVAPNSDVLVKAIEAELAKK